jgi:hypothetical protein
MKFEIKSWITGYVLFSIETETWKLALEAAVKSGANLEGANLRGANLRGANLRGANLEGANLRGANLRDANLEGANLEGANLEGANLLGVNLRGANLRGANLEGVNLEGAKDLRLPTGELLSEYIADVMPALLTGGGKALEDVAEHWGCHTWENCPLAFAYDCKGIEGLPPLLRPRGEQFVQLFDGGLLPRPVPGEAKACEVKP